MLSLRHLALQAAAIAVMLTLATGCSPPAHAAGGGEKIAELFESSFTHEATGDTKRALNDVLSILRLDKAHYVANLRAGWLYYSGGRYDDAVKFYRQATELAPKAIEPQLGLMLPLMAAKRWSEAAVVGERVLKRAPRNYYAASRMAFIAFSLGRYKAAEKRYQGVMADYPSDTEMMLGLGWTYLRQGRRDDARRLFLQVLSIRRKNVNAQAGLDALQG